MARYPTGPFTTRRTGCYLCRRITPADGSCGVRGYPCTHFGLDLFATSPGVFAPEAGTIVDVSDGTRPPYVGYNPGVILMRGVSGAYHLLGHMEFNTIRVRPGQFVLEGTQLGQFNQDVGHVHYEIRRTPTGSSDTNTIDPARWLADQQALAPSDASSGLSTTQKLVIAMFATAGLGGIAWLTLRTARRTVG